MVVISITCWELFMYESFWIAYQNGRYCFLHSGQKSPRICKNRHTLANFFTNVWPKSTSSVASFGGKIEIFIVILELCAGTLSELMLPSKVVGVTPLYRQAKVNVWVNMATFLFVDASSCMPPSSSSKEQPRAVPKLKKKTLWHGFLSSPFIRKFLLQAKE